MLGVQIDQHLEAVWHEHLPDLVLGAEINVSLLAKDSSTDT